MPLHDRKAMAPLKRHGHGAGRMHQLVLSMTARSWAPLKQIDVRLTGHLDRALHDRKVMAPLKPQPGHHPPHALQSLHDRKVMAPLKHLKISRVLLVHACVSTVAKIGAAWNPHRHQQAIMARTRGLTLPATDQPTLEQWARSQSLPHHQVQRARMLLGLAAGQTLAAVAAAVGTSDETVARWRNRYLGRGLGGAGGPPPQWSAANLHGRGPGGHVEEAAGGAARRPHLLEPEPDGPGNRHLDRPAEPLVVGGRDPAPPRAHLQAVERPPVRGQAARRDRGLRKKRHPTL